MFVVVFIEDIVISVFADFVLYGDLVTFRLPLKFFIVHSLFLPTHRPFTSPLLIPWNLSVKGH